MKTFQFKGFVAPKTWYLKGNSFDIEKMQYFHQQTFAIKSDLNDAILQFEINV